MKLTNFWCIGYTRRFKGIDKTTTTTKKKKKKKKKKQQQLENKLKNNDKKIKIKPPNEPLQE